MVVSKYLSKRNDPMQLGYENTMVWVYLHLHTLVA